MENMLTLRKDSLRDVKRLRLLRLRDIRRPPGVVSVRVKAGGGGGGGGGGGTGGGNNILYLPITLNWLLPLHPPATPLTLA